MARFVECTMRSPESKVFVNLDRVVAVRDEGDGSLIIYAGGDDCFLRVRERPSHILANEL